mmetsp:Transcript_74394/g.197620  ORF Transcript_74394/g.197620 Transcript_74394/m.197620 type:complete len:293 (-) Transcript_74394:50-928(-)
MVIDQALVPLLNSGLTGDQLEVIMMPWYTGKFLPSGLYNADKGSYYDQLTFPHLCALKPTLPQPAAANAPGLVSAAKFISCDMGYIQSASGRTEETMQSCAAQSGLAMEPFQTCKRSDEGYNIMRGADFAAKIHSVLDRTIEAAPYVFVNGDMLECPGYSYCSSTWVPMTDGKYGHKPLPRPGDFLTVVCSAMDPAPAACAAVLSGAHPQAVKPTPACENCEEVLPSGWLVEQEREKGPPQLATRLLAAAGAALLVGAVACFAWRRRAARVEEEEDCEQLVRTEGAAEPRQD